MSELQAPTAAPRTTLPAAPVRARWVGRVSLGSRIKHSRLDLGMTQAELARDLTSVAYLSRIEANERQPTPALLADLAQRLRVAPPVLARRASPTVEGLRFELAHTDLLLACEQYDDAARVGGDLAEVATRIGAADVADAARIAQAAALAASGHHRSALRIVRPLTAGPMGLAAAAAEARVRLELSDIAGAITVGHIAASRFASGEELSALAGADLARTLCRSYQAFGRHRVSAHIAHLALQHLPGDDALEGEELSPSDAASYALSYRNFDQAGRQIERTIAALQLADLRAKINQLRAYSLAGDNPHPVPAPRTDSPEVR